MRITHAEGIRIVGNFPTAQTEVSFESFVYPDETGVITNTVDRERVEIDNLIITYQHLEAFKNSVARYGLTRALVSFADHDKSLSSIVPEVPAIENLSADRSAKNSADVVAALEGKMGQMIELIKQKIKDHFAGYFKKHEMLTKALRSSFDKMKTLNTVISNGERVFNSTEAKEKMIELPHCDQLLHTLSLIEKLPSVLIEVFKVNMPMNIGGMKPWVDEVRSKLTPVHEVCHYIMNEEGVVVPNKDSILDESYTKNSMESLGYDSVDKFHTIYAEFVKVMHALDNGVHWNLVPPPGCDYHVYFMACNRAFDLLDSYQHAGWWVQEKSMMALKAIFWCSDKKKS